MQASRCLRWARSGARAPAFPSAAPRGSDPGRQTGHPSSALLPPSAAAAANPAAGGTAPAGLPAAFLRSLRRASPASGVLVSHCVLQGQNGTVDDGPTSPCSETSLNKNKNQTTTLQGKEFRVNKQSFSVKQNISLRWGN
ncbi:uncharacterized protein LOC111548424 [Piliocolobus tephrosceles]|uniref:uncharacterized protein LOC111548424 n=1 Tax=Piliocolobus tephrosceles TaxID=591936 RepID=UPI000C2A94A4|nr:uncharacterized protein LOC111548424 [Piliocolobus tephrosceles]